jgi:hypothetical protein
MPTKPTYDPTKTGPTCANCGFNYLKKRPFTNLCPHCFWKALPGAAAWLLTGVFIGLLLVYGVVILFGW